MFLTIVIMLVCFALGAYFRLNIPNAHLSEFETELSHGEVFVAYDGAETDLDLVHDARFVQRHFTKRNSFSTVQVYETVIRNECRVDYLG